MAEEDCMTSLTRRKGGSYKRLGGHKGRQLQEEEVRMGTIVLTVARGRETATTRMRMAS